MPIGVAARIFPAKVDLWFYALFYGGGALMLGLALYLWKRARGRLGAITVSACGLLFLMVAGRADDPRGDGRWFPRRPGLALCR